jgi:ATP-binding protein involved in chromosome partitioning
MAGFTCPTCGDEHAPFGSDPEISTDVLAELPIDESLRSTEGDVPAAFRDLGEDVREALADRTTVTVPDTALDLRGVPDRARVEQVRTEFGALAPGESLHLVTDTRPGDVDGVLGDLAAAPPRVATERKGSDRWAMRITKPAPDAADDAAC